MKTNSFFKSCLSSRFFSLSDWLLKARFRLTYRQNELGLKEPVAAIVDWVVFTGLISNIYFDISEFPEYYPAEKTVVTINHQVEGQPEHVVAKNIDFLFHSKLGVVHRILSNESDPLNFLCSSFQIGDLQNVDLILSGNLEKKVPEGIELLKNSKSMLVHEQGW